nr:MAG TPA: hypothetical protein [Crassvirales sp.]
MIYGALALIGILRNITYFCTCKLTIREIKQ